MFAMSAPFSAQTVDCGCEDKPLPEIIGVVNGVKITKQDLSPETRARVEQLQKQVIDARERELDLQIDSILLESEAKKRGVSPSQVIKDDVIAKVQTPTEAEAQAFYDQNKSKIQGEFKDEKNNVIEFLRYQRQQEQAQKLAERLRTAAQVKVLAKPTAPAATAADRALRETKWRQYASSAVADFEAFGRHVAEAGHLLTQQELHGSFLL